MSFSQRQQLTEPFKIATMHQRGYLLEIAPSFQSWFICFFDDRWRQSTLSYYTIDRNARDYYWSLDLLRRGHSPANQWAALGPFQGLRKLYHYYRGTSVGMQYIDDEQIYKHLAAALARGQMEVHKVYDPHGAYRAFAAAAAGGTPSAPAEADGALEAKPEPRRIESPGTTPSQSFAPTPLGPAAPITPAVARLTTSAAANSTSMAAAQSTTLASVALRAGTAIGGLFYSPATGGEKEVLIAANGTKYTKYSDEVAYTATAQNGEQWTTLSPETDVKYRMWLANGGTGTQAEWEAAGQPLGMEQVDVECFNAGKTIKDKIPEFDRQLHGQQSGLNNLSVEEYLEGRERFRAIKRQGTGKAQQKARAEYRNELMQKFFDELREQGIRTATAKQQAAAMATEVMSTLAALHNPDLYVGGKDVVTEMGDRRVNSSIGAQWRSRVAELDEA
ncbi:MAG: hypothetical protein KA754_11810, partial [Corallincola sp.]|nr:hypothetical protein [Corallincola sp.]